MKNKEPLRSKRPEDQEFIDAVRVGGLVLERATRKLIKRFLGYPKSFQSKYHLNAEEAIDAYTDAILDLIRMIRVGRDTLRYQLSTYLYRMTLSNCIDQARKNNRSRPEMLDDILEPIEQLNQPDLLRELFVRESMDSVLRLLDGMRGKCKEIILKWAYWGYSMQEVAEEVGLKNGNVAKVQKNRCVGRLKAGLDLLNLDTPFKKD